MQPQGASGSPVVSGATVTFADAYPGVDLRYEATPTGVRELVVLESPEAVRDFEFTIDAPGSTPSIDSNDAVVLGGTSGESLMVDSPYAYEAGDLSTSSHAAVDVSLDEQEGSGFDLELQLSRGWASVETRDFPIVIDPTLSISPPSDDCWISEAVPNDSYCGASIDYLRTGVTTTTTNSFARRALLKFNLSSIPNNATVTSAQTKLYLDATQTANSNEAEYRLWRLTRTWDDGEVTWNKYNSAFSWTTPGGDHSTDISAGSHWLSGQTSGYRSFNSTPLVEAWLGGTVNNRGMILKQVGDNSSSAVANILYFVSSDNVDAIQHAPTLVVNYTEPAVAAGDKIGERETFTYEAQRLNDRTELKVNVATGNLLLKQTDLMLSGTGLNFSFDRFYNSLATNADPSKISAGWSTSTASTIRLEFPSSPSGRVIFVGPSGYRVRFDPSLAGGYTAAEPGIKATLENVTGGYKLTWFSKETWHFNTSGKLTQQKDKNGNTISFTYTNGDLTKVTDTRGKEINLTYSNGRLTTLTDTSIGRTYTYGYDASGRLASSKLSAYTSNPSDPNINKVTSYEYDSSGRLWRITDPRAGLIVTEITYVSATDNRVYTIERHADGTVAGPTTTFSYFSATTGCQGANSAVAKTEVNGPRADADVPSTTTDSRGDDISTYCYDEHDRVRETIDAKGNKRSTKYTSNSNVAELSEAGVGASTTIGYDSGGNATSLKLPTGGTAHMSYGDSANNPHFPTGVKDFAVGSDSGTDTWVYDYDDNGNLIEARAPSVSGQEIRYLYCYDGDGNITRIDTPTLVVPPDDYPDSDPWCRSTNSAGELSYPANSGDIIFYYDNLGRLTKVDPAGPHATYEITEYDAASRIKETKDGRGNISSYTYDALDRIRTITTTFTGGGTTTTATVSYTYDPNGNLLSRTDGSGTHLFTYDPLNRMGTEDPPSNNDGITYSYDAASNLRSIDVELETDPVSYQNYDEVNLVGRIVDQNGRATLFEHNDRNLRTKTTYPGGAVMETKYDGSKRVKCTFSYKGTSPPTALRTDECPKVGASETGNSSYNPDVYIAYSRYGYSDGKDTNRRESFTDRFGTTVNYDYDSIGRLLGADASSGTDYEYQYDKLGNVTKETVGTGVTHYAFGDGNELCWSGSSAGSSCATVPAGNTSFTFNGAGSLLSNSSGLAATYNVMNQMASVTPAGGTPVSMSYADVTQDRRVTAGGLSFNYTQLGLSAQFFNQGEPHINRFVRDPYGQLVAMTQNEVDRTAPDHYYHFDGLGSVVATTNDSGNVIRRYSYEPYGNELSPSSSDPNPWRYASGYFDKDTEWLKFGTRYYDPELLRWTQRDPSLGRPNEPMTLNAYTYVGCNPLNATDPSGRLDIGFSPMGMLEDAWQDIEEFAIGFETCNEYTQWAPLVVAGGGFVFLGPVGAAGGFAIGEAIAIGAPLGCGISNAMFTSR